MKELVIVSGKGGTGKTSIAASFAALAPRRVLVDCDVDAADLHLVTEHRVLREEVFESGWVAVRDEGVCTQCGECARVCRFDAIDERYSINPLKCEGCGVCEEVCSFGAIEMRRRVSGAWYFSTTPRGPFLHAKLGVAEGNSGRLVSLLKTEARKLMESDDCPLMIVDGSPGIGCPVIASVSGAHAVLIVAEPTPSGMHDLGRIAGLAKRFRSALYACVNKYDINEGMADEIAGWCADNGINLLAKIPHDTGVTAAQIAGKSLVEASSGPAAGAVAALWDRISAELR